MQFPHPRLVLIGAATLATASAASADPRRAQDSAYEAAQAGQILSLGDIIRRTSRSVPGSYVGSDYDDRRRIYRLKYLDGDDVIKVDVDATNGRIINRTDR